MQQRIQNCLDCHSICLNTITYCLQQGGQHAEIGHIERSLSIKPKPGKEKTCPLAKVILKKLESE